MTGADAGLRLVFADAALLVVDKPAGLLAVPGRGPDKADCLSSRLQDRHPEALVVHRLDQATSGLLVFARDKETQRRLGIAFSQRQVHKCYVAVVAGRPEPASGSIDLPISVDWPRRPLRIIDAAHGKPSLTRYRTLAQAAGSTRLALEPVTGRSHQLRVHLQAIGHPILGDTLYADPASAAAAARLLLHAEALAFAHPLSGEPLEFLAAVPF